jgi:hypothetical protein
MKHLSDLKKLLMDNIADALGDRSTTEEETEAQGSHDRRPTQEAS